jgi:hypothetical protein
VGRKSIILLKGSQATPARPNVKVTFLISDCFIDNLEKNRRHPQQGVLLMSLKSGGLHEKHAVATWNLGTISAFA